MPSISPINSTTLVIWMIFLSLSMATTPLTYRESSNRTFGTTFNGATAFKEGSTLSSLTLPPDSANIASHSV